MYPRIIGPVTMLASLVCASPALASTNIIVVSGTGTIDPGLPCPPSGCSVHYDFTAIVAGQDASGTASCTFDGVDTFPGGATVAAGSGSGTMACSGGVSMSGTATFRRTAADLELEGTVTMNGRPFCTIRIPAVQLPRSPSPVTGVTLDGVGTVTC